MSGPPVARCLLALVTLMIAIVALGSGPAHAHGPEGEMTVIVAEPAGASEIELEVGILYTNDQELAEEATVTATLTGPDGTVVGPVELPRRSGATYAATVPVPTPGSWAIAVESAAPAASATTVVEVTGQAPATSAAPTSSAAPTTTATTATASSVAAVPAAQTEPSSGTPWAVIAVGVAIVIGAGIAISLWAQRPDRA